MLRRQYLRYSCVESSARSVGRYCILSLGSLKEEVKQGSVLCLLDMQNRVSKRGVNLEVASFSLHFLMVITLWGFIPLIMDSSVDTLPLSLMMHHHCPFHSNYHMDSEELISSHL